ncbi:MAG TPA: alkaline phosphatase PhoX [Thermoleophilaceae bacterium]|nr:alkaline phosphatase PhoX [Thermoleophilaceae bacterium]
MATDTSFSLRRRHFLATGIGGAAVLFTPAWLRDVLAAPAVGGPGPYGELLPANEVGLQLPPGFTGRQISRGGDLIGAYPWHFSPDGQATFRTGDGGFVLVQNSEAPGVLGGGSSAMRFGPDGEIDSAYRILTGTNLNCAGGPTPWGTWLSGEEHEGGMIWEADPAGILPQLPRPALGNFSHEAAAVDPVDGHVYLSEDQGDGLFYRFTPDTPGNLASGVLEAARRDGAGNVSWLEVPDPNIVTAGTQPRYQVPDATPFDGGEGLWYSDDIVYYTTKGDKRVWAYHCREQTMEVVYDGENTPGAALNAVDNVTVSPSGDVYVCEDGGNMEICLISPDRVVSPFLRLVGADHEGSEMTGVVFDPSGTRMYFSSQRAEPLAPLPAGLPSEARVLAHGATFEVTGPFRLPPGGVPESWVFGPPAGELATGGLSGLVPGLGLDVKRASLAGLRTRVTVDQASKLHAVVRTFDLKTESRGDGTHDRPLPVTLGRWSGSVGKGVTDVSLGLGRLAVKSAVLTVVAERADGTRRVAAERLALV